MAFIFLVAAIYDYLLEMGDKTVKSSECNDCHQLIYEEWSKDFHAKAYLNANLEGAVDLRQTFHGKNISDEVKDSTSSPGSAL